MAKSNRYLRDIPLPGLVEGPMGYRGPAVARIVGITYRQLDHWTSTGLVRASVRDAEGSGTQRLYAFEDIVQLRVIKRLRDAGVSLQRIRTAMDTIREQGLDLQRVTLVSDSSHRVLAVDDRNRVMDLLMSGQGMFAIAVEPVVAELQAEVTELDAERADPPVSDQARHRAPGS